MSKMERDDQQYPELQGTQPITFGEDFISFIRDAGSPDRIRLTYHYAQDSGRVYATVSFGQRAQGPPGHAHGGAISAVFDELMGACCWVNGYPALTAQYTTRFLQPTPLEKTVLFVAQIRQIDGSKLNLKAKVHDAEGQCYAEARGLFIAQAERDILALSKVHQTLMESIKENPR